MSIPTHPRYIGRDAKAMVRLLHLVIWRTAKRGSNSCGLFLKLRRKANRSKQFLSWDGLT